MKTPLNPTAMETFRKLVDLIERQNDPGATVKVWASDDYVSLEINSCHLPINDVRLAIGATPMEADQVAETERRLATIRSRANDDND